MKVVERRGRPGPRVFQSVFQSGTISVCTRARARVVAFDSSSSRRLCGPFAASRFKLAGCELECDLIFPRASRVDSACAWISHRTRSKTRSSTAICLKIATPSSSSSSSSASAHRTDERSSRMQFFLLSLLRIVAFTCRRIYAAFGRDLAGL